MRGQRTIRRLGSALLAAGLTLLIGCISRQAEIPSIDPDVVRAEIARLLPKSVTAREAWAADIYAAFEALKIAPTRENICAVSAITQQESSFQVDPRIPGLPAIARKALEMRAARFDIPRMALYAALEMKSPSGETYNERLDKAATERDLSEIFEDFIGMVPLGNRLFADWNPVRTGGPMQVSVAYAERHAMEHRYPYPVPTRLRHEVFTRRGGVYFGIAHLLDYPADYHDMIYRFADYNAGHYASRNAAFQNAVSMAAKMPLALDGDLLHFGEDAGEPSQTELAVRQLAYRIDMSQAQIHNDLRRGDEERFAQTQLYKRVFALAEKSRRRPLPRAILPHIPLESAKITRKLSTQWFANRVDGRYRQCLAARR